MLASASTFLGVCCRQVSLLLIMLDQSQLPRRTGQDQSIRETRERRERARTGLKGRAPSSWPRQPRSNLVTGQTGGNGSKPNLELFLTGDARKLVENVSG